MHHKKLRPPNRRAGCKLCKPWKQADFRPDEMAARASLGTGATA